MVKRIGLRAGAPETPPTDREYPLTPAMRDSLRWQEHGMRGGFALFFGAIVLFGCPISFIIRHDLRGVGAIIVPLLLFGVLVDRWVTRMMRAALADGRFVRIEGEMYSETLQRGDFGDAYFLVMGRRRIPIASVAVAQALAAPGWRSVDICKHGGILFEVRDDAGDVIWRNTAYRPTESPGGARGLKGGR